MTMMRSRGATPQRRGRLTKLLIARHKVRFQSAPPIPIRPLNLQTKRCRCLKTCPTGLQHMWDSTLVKCNQINLAFQ